MQTLEQTNIFESKTEELQLTGPTIYSFVERHETSGRDIQIHISSFETEEGANTELKTSSEFIEEENRKNKQRIYDSSHKPGDVWLQYSKDSYSFRIIPKPLQLHESLKSPLKKGDTIYTLLEVCENHKGDVSVEVYPFSEPECAHAAINKRRDEIAILSGPLTNDDDVEDWTSSFKDNSNNYYTYVIETTELK